MRKSWQVFHDRLLLGNCFRSFVLPVLEYGSAVWCSSVDTHLKLLDRVVSDASFLTGGVFECDLAHRRSASVLCMLYNIRCNPMHTLYGALPVPYVPVLVTRGAVIARRYTYALPRCRTSQYRRTFILLSVSLWNDLGDPVTYGFQEHGQCPFIGQLLAPFLSPAVFSFSSFVLWIGIVGLGSSDRWAVNHSIPSLHSQPFLIIIIMINMFLFRN